MGWPENYDTNKYQCRACSAGSVVGLFVLGERVRVCVCSV